MTSSSQTCAPERDAPADIRELAARVGNDITLVQGAGGNASVKLGDTLWIKASGTWLAKAREEPVFAAVRLSGVRRRVAEGQADPASAELLDLGPPGLRPSIETGLHALMPHAIVLHIHSVDAIALSACEDGQARLRERLEGLAWAWVPYVKPGRPLSEAVSEALRAGPADVLVLANHGLVIGASNRADAERLLSDVTHRLRLQPGEAPPADLQQLEALSLHGAYRPASQAWLHAMATQARQLAIATAGTLYPDHVVFLGPAAVALAPGQSIDALRAERARSGLGLPELLLVPGAGVLLRRDLNLGELAMVECLALVLARIPPDAAVRYLADTDVAALLDWDAEKYRKLLAQQRAPSPQAAC